ncbi:MAG: superoxide dismutase family protein [Clostridia bacterium]|nr:superoxide dismutase family protein [Clostridia bacterium]
MQYNFNSPEAIALVYGKNEAAALFGRVKFYQKNNCVLVVADIEGLPPNDTGFYGFHIHEGASCTGEGFSDSGSHFNPKGTPHPNHAGDLPPLMRCGDKAHLEVLTDRFKVSDIIGRTVIIHGKPDDFNTQPSGNAGTKIACGVIEAW